MLAPLSDQLRDRQDLTEADIRLACDELLNEEVPLPVRADFLAALHRKGETPAEIATFVKVLLERAVQPELGRKVLDVCGTGGDKAGLFNVSTAVMFTAAACGARVVKHGNRGVTSKSGGADVLEALGVRLDLPPRESLEVAGCCFLFAQRYHPAFKAVGPVRKALAEEGTPTIFNITGPLLNPAHPEYQFAGVFSDHLLEIYAEVFRLLGRQRAWVAHGAGGLDEVSTLGPTAVHAMENGHVRTFAIDPQEFGISLAHVEDLRGGTAAENARVLEDLLAGRDDSPRRDIVALNAACALVVAEVAADLPLALEKVDEVLDTGAAAEVLEKLRALG